MLAFRVTPFKPSLPSYYVPEYVACVVVVLVGFYALFRLRAGRRQAKRTTWPADVGLSALLFVLALLVAEGLFVASFDLSDSFAASNMGRLWYWRHLRTNNRGYRDNVDYHPAPPTGVFRIVFLGDSFTFGHGVPRAEDRFSNLIRRRLKQEAPGRYEVYNISYPGWSTRMEIDAVRNLAREGFRADLFVLVYVLNDGIDLMPESAEYDAALERLRPKAFVLRKSYLANFLYYRLRLRRLPGFQNYYSWASKTYEPPYWEQHQQSLNELRTACRELAPRFAVVTFPFLHNMGNENPFGKAHRRLADFWESAGVRNIDLLATLKAYKSADLVVNRFDAHPNEGSHRLAAKVIYRDLLVPELALGGDDGAASKSNGPPASSAPIDK